MEDLELQHIIRAIILSAKKSVTLDELMQVFSRSRDISLAQVTLALKNLLKASDPVHELKEISGGYRYQIKEEYSIWIQNARGINKEEPDAKLSRVVNEVLAIIAYKQPISRSEVDSIRGAATNTVVFEQLEDKGWVKIVGFGGTKNRAALYGTTREFLEYFNLNSIYELPDLKEVVPV